jgi:hypothetical protein
MDYKEHIVIPFQNQTGWARDFSAGDRIAVQGTGAKA